MLSEAGKHIPQVYHMVLWGGRKDKHVVQVYGDKIIKQPLKDSMHQPLERGWSIREPKGHHEELKQSVAGRECCLMNMCRCDCDLVIPRSKVYLAKHLGSREPV